MLPYSIMSNSSIAKSMNEKDYLISYEMKCVCLGIYIILGTKEQDRKSNLRPLNHTQLPVVL
jgi:hypothetical protein